MNVSRIFVALEISVCFFIRENGGKIINVGNNHARQMDSKHTNSCTLEVFRIPRQLHIPTPFSFTADKNYKRN
jgi:hypothetical protein